MIYKLRHKYDEAFRIRNGYGLSPIRNKREERALIEFCRDELKDKESMKLNPKRKEVFKETVKHYDNKGYVEMEYVEDNIKYYWS